MMMNRTAKSKYKPKTLLKHYELVLNSGDFKEMSPINDINIDLYGLFDEGNALSFIKKYLMSSGLIEYKDESKKKMRVCVDMLTEFRAKHTLSAFLLGIVLRDNLNLDIRKWARPISSYSSTPSFACFWSLICLLHDIGYKYENGYIKHLDPKTNTKIGLADIYRYFNVKYQITDISRHKELIANYFSYRVNENKKIDHGIVGAALVYDALMTVYYDTINQSSTNDSKHTNSKYFKFTPDFPKFCEKISNTIALHNMWRANSESAEKYQRYDLHQLVSNSEQSEIVYYRDDSLLFLLGIVDSIDPIKSLCTDERGHRLLEPRVVLDNVYLLARASGKQKRIILDVQCKGREIIQAKVKGLSEWLGVETTTDDIEMRIDIIS